MYTLTLHNYFISDVDPHNFHGIVPTESERACLRRQAKRNTVKGVGVEREIWKSEAKRHSSISEPMKSKLLCFSSVSSRFSGEIVVVEQGETGDRGCLYGGHSLIHDVHEEYDRPRRSKKIADHVHFNDYFVNLAAVLDLLRQKNDKQLKQLRDDLMFLQKNYKIIKKQKQK